MADAYKLKADASFPEPLVENDDVSLSVGRNYAAGSYVLASELTERDRDRAENGDLDHLLEGVSAEEAQDARAVIERGVFIPEHEAEAVILETYGHEVVPRDQVLELRAAGSDAAQSAQEDAKADGADERPGITRAEFPALADVSRGDVNNVPQESEPVSEERLASAPSSSVRGVEQPPGLQVGQDKAAQEGEQGAVEQVEQAAPRRRGRPRKADQEIARQQEAVEGQREAAQQESQDR